METFVTWDESTHHPSVAVIMQQLICSPLLPMHVRELESLLQKEQIRRKRFYEEMSEGQKVEFINGEVIMQSPAKLRHTTASRNLGTLLNTYVSKHSLGYVGQEKMLITLNSGAIRSIVFEDWAILVRAIFDEKELLMALQTILSNDD